MHSKEHTEQYPLTEKHPCKEEFLLHTHKYGPARAVMSTSSALPMCLQLPNTRSLVKLIFETWRR